MKELVDSVMHKFLSSHRDGNALLVLQRPMSLSLIARNLKYNSQEDRVVSQKESHLVMAILTHKPPYVAAYGVMMSRGDCERVGRAIRLFICTTGDLWQSVLRVPISPRRSH